MSRAKAWIYGSILTGLLCIATVILVRNVHFPVLLRHTADIPQSQALTERSVVKVARVIDGDTIELEDGRKVRYIGIDAPETVDPRRGVQCFGEEASVFNSNLVSGKAVRLEKDFSETDKYGRLLRFVYLEDGTSVNELLVRDGYAFASAYPPDISKKDVFRSAEILARAEGKGLWSPDTCDGKK